MSQAFWRILLKFGCFVFGHGPKIHVEDVAGSKWSECILCGAKLENY